MTTSELTVPVTVSLSPALAAKLTEPGVAESLTSLLSHADLVAILLDGLDGLIGRSEVIGDSLLSGIDELKGSASLGELTAGVDVKAITDGLLGLLLQVPQLSGLVGTLTPGVTEQLGTLTKGVEAGAATYAADPVRINGIFSAAKLLKDPDINRALSFAATIAKAIGHELGK